MASLDDLKKRISSVKSTQKITKAMKMVAAAKLRRAQESAEKGRPYSDKMNNIILNLSNGISDIDNAPKLLSGTGEDKVHLCVVMTSDRGLCGGFNTNIIKKAKLYFQKILDEGKTLKIITVGTKGYDQLKRLYGDKIIENGVHNTRKTWHEKCATQYMIIYHSGEARKHIWLRDKGKCKGCGKQCTRRGWDLDHIKPLMEQKLSMAVVVLLLVLLLRHQMQQVQN